jgi:hypothetical protein
MKVTLTTMLLTCVLLGACTDEAPGDDNDNRFSVSIPQSASRNLDLLIVIDNSGSMMNKFQLCLAPVDVFSGLVGLPGVWNLHLGVTSTDLGAGAYDVTNCEELGGDGGILGRVGGVDRGELCVGPGERYFVDIEPINCTIDKDQSGACTSHSCTQANCDAVAGSNEMLTLADWNGCPRCRNNTVYSTLEETSHCLAGLDASGCGFAQPLETMYQALNDNPQNTGFLREDAYLGIIFVTDGDDCSAADPEIFDPGQDSIDSPLGYFTTFRCFEFGVTCDINERTHVGLRQHCQPRDDPGALLHPISRYVQLLGDLKDPQLIAVAALAGPVDDHSVTVVRDPDNRPWVQYSCIGGGDLVWPSIRLNAFVEAFHEEADMVWAYQSLCHTDCFGSMLEIGWNMQDSLNVFQCLPEPLKGCADVGALFDSPQAEVTCAVNGRCLPQCRVTDVFERGTENELQSAVPPCVDVMADGTLSPGNIDRSLAYGDGRPQERDANLPVQACWYINYKEDCPQSNYAQMIISRQSDPPPRSFAEVSCAKIPQTEETCDDGLDNDEDCLVDEEDPDC